MGQLEENQTGPLRSKIDEVSCEYVFVEQLLGMSFGSSLSRQQIPGLNITRGGFFGGLG
jgi:hypothetical protein